MDNKNIVWFRENIFEQSQIHPSSLKLLRKIGISKGYKYLIWDENRFPMKYKTRYNKIVTLTYSNGLGPRRVYEQRDVFEVDGMTLIVVRYNHLKKGFQFSHIEFNSKKYNAFDYDN